MSKPGLEGENTGSRSTERGGYASVSLNQEARFFCHSLFNNQTTSTPLVFNKRRPKGATGSRARPVGHPHPAPQGGGAQGPSCGLHWEASLPLSESALTPLRKTHPLFWPLSLLQAAAGLAKEQGSRNLWGRRLWGVGTELRPPSPEPRSSNAWARAGEAEGRIPGNRLGDREVPRPCPPPPRRTAARGLSPAQPGCRRPSHLLCPAGPGAQAPAAASRGRAAVRVPSARRLSGLAGIPQDRRICGPEPRPFSVATASFPPALPPSLPPPPPQPPCRHRSGYSDTRILRGGRDQEVESLEETSWEVLQDLWSGLRGCGVCLVRDGRLGAGPPALTAAAAASAPVQRG